MTARVCQKRYADNVCVLERDDDEDDHIQNDTFFLPLTRYDVTISPYEKDIAMARMMERYAGDLMPIATTNET
jgi:hypothetical protein